MPWVEPLLDLLVGSLIVWYCTGIDLIIGFFSLAFSDGIWYIFVCNEEIEDFYLIRDSCRYDKF